MDHSIYVPFVFLNKICLKIKKMRNGRMKNTITNIDGKIYERGITVRIDS